MYSSVCFKYVSEATCGKGTKFGNQLWVNVSRIEFLEGSNNVYQQ